jgi:hypothetical protein
MLEEFKEQFKVVFNEDFTVKNCGRANTIKLIRLANECKNGKDFGDVVTGKMNIDNLVSYYLTI